MVNVTARKIREQGVDRANSRIYTGYLISYPAVGRGIVIFRDPHGHRMITTPVKRILGEADGKMLYIETENSVYRLEFHGEPLFPLKNFIDASDSEAAKDGSRDPSADASIVE
jgi:hypothetical protein